jgi:hypothetical protein
MDHIDLYDVADFVQDILTTLVEDGRASLCIVSDGDFVANAHIEEIVREDAEDGVMLTLPCWPNGVYHLAIYSCCPGQDD